MEIFIVYFTAVVLLALAPLVALLAVAGHLLNSINKAWAEQLRAMSLWITWRKAELEAERVAAEDKKVAE